jgi:lactoylglutathione lyase
MTAWLGQYCLNVADLERSVAWYSGLGLECTSRTEIPDAYEAIVEHPSRGSKLQLAQQKGQQGPVDLGNAFWKLYVNTANLSATFERSRELSSEVVLAPQRLDRWPVSIAFVKDPDGYLVELVQRHPWAIGDPADGPWLGQYCINVADLDATVAFYEALGLVCTSRTEIDHAFEAILETSGKGSKMQLAQQKGGPVINRGHALWKLYVNTDACEALYEVALGAGAEPLSKPQELELWPVTIAFVADPNGHMVEIVERRDRDSASPMK